MDKADQDFLTHLFKENNQLRAHITNLTRQLHNVTTSLEEANLEIKSLKQSEQSRHQSKSHEKTEKQTNADKNANRERDVSGEHRFLIEKQEAEINQLSEELIKSKNDFVKEAEKNRTCG
jgi:uncharacterized caspase-like protein